MTATSRTPETIAREAAQWFVRLDSDDEAERMQAQADFEAWRREDARHEQAATRLLGFLDGVRGAARLGRPARAGIEASFADKPQRSRRGLGRALVLAALVVLPAALGLRYHPAATLMADVRSGTGAWTQRTLDDGSRIALGSGSALDIRYDPKTRLLEMVRGEVWVDVAKDPKRPLVVSTPRARAQALGTRFIVRDDGEATWITVLESTVSVTGRAPASSAANDTYGDVDTAITGTTLLRAGQRLRVDANGQAGAVETVDAESVEDAWHTHRLVVRDRPMAEVLAEIDRHRPGLMHVDRAAVAALRVSAVLPLDDTDRALRLLATSFPQMRVRIATPYLVVVDAAP